MRTSTPSMSSSSPLPSLLLPASALVGVACVVLCSCAGVQTGILDPGHGAAPPLRTTTVTAAGAVAAEWIVPLDTANAGGDVRLEHQFGEELSLGLEGFAATSLGQHTRPAGYARETVMLAGGKALATVWITDDVSLHAAAGAARFADSFEDDDGDAALYGLSFDSHGVGTEWCGDLLLVGGRAADLGGGGVDTYGFGGLALTGSLDAPQPGYAPPPVRPTLVVGAGANMPIAEHFAARLSGQLQSHPVLVDPVSGPSTLLLLSTLSLFPTTVAGSVGLVATF